jgi:UDP-glucose 4-epimerase
MKVLLTGGAGYIGSVCGRRLSEAGHEIAVFDNFSLGHRAAVVPGTVVFEGDLQDAAAVERALAGFQPDVVMHFAALALVGESMQVPESYFSVNVGGGLNLLRAMLRQGVRRLVFSSTCATYGVPESLPIRETTPQVPINPYGESKLMFERMIRWFAELHGMSYAVFRYFNAGGAWGDLGEDHEPETHLIPNVIRVLLGQKEFLEVFGRDYQTPDGTCLRDYIHVRDLAEAHLLAVEKAVDGFFNLGTGSPTSVLEVVQACERASGKRARLEYRPRRAGDPPSLFAAADPAREILGWVPRHSGMDEIARSAWEWHSRHPHGYGVLRG